MDPVGLDDDQLEVMRREAAQADFRSDEARLDFERARRRRLAVWSFLAVLFVAWGFGMYQLGQGRSVKSPPGGAGHGGHGGPGPIEPVGDPAAGLKIVCTLPESSGCQDPVVKLLQSLAQPRPDKVRVEFQNMDSAGEEARAEREPGGACANVRVNGQTDFDVDGPHGRRHVSLVGKAPTHYSFNDLHDAVVSVYIGLYGVPDGPLSDMPQLKQELRRQQPPDGSTARASAGAAAVDFALPAPQQVDLKKTPAAAP